MGFAVSPLQSCGGSSNLSLLPYGVLSATIGNLDTSGKRVQLQFGGKIASKTTLEVDAIRYDYKNRQAYVQISSHKNDTGVKGQIDPYSRQLQLEISTKKAHFEGPWTVNLVNPQGKIIDSKSFALGGC